MDRATKLILIIGYNGTGKTTITKKLVVSELKKATSHILVVTPDDIEWNMLPEVHHKFIERVKTYKKARKIIYNEKIEYLDPQNRALQKGNTVDLIADYFRDGLVIFDDCRSYFNAALESSLHNLLIRRRQKMIDIIMVAHGFTEIPPKAFTFASDIILFKTMDNIDKRKPYLKDFEKMKAMQQYVNTEAEKNPHFNIVIPQI
ncbi:MAG: ATP-binding protein [Bacteroidia bacterium]